MEENEITFHAVEKDGVVTAIWEMRGRKHIRTIDPRGVEGRQILHSYTADEAATEHSSAAGAGAEGGTHEQAQS